VPSAGIGPGAILHADYTLVNAAKPAKVGETILIFLTGLGPVTPAVPDGAPPNSPLEPHLQRTLPAVPRPVSN